MIYKKSKKLLLLVSKHYLLIGLLLLIFIVGVIASYRIFFSDPKYIYAKIKIGQGYWWANTAKPGYWFLGSVKKGDEEFDIFGKPIAHIYEVKSYPLWNNSQYDIYLYTKLQVQKNSKTRQLSFNRSPIAIGAPIELNLQNTAITGTIIAQSYKPFSEKYEEKIITLVNKGGYSKDYPYRYNNLIIGDTHSNGKDVTFEILGKKLQPTILTVQNNLTTEIIERETENVQDIIVKAKIKVKKEGTDYIYGEEYKAAPGYAVPFGTKNYIFDNYIITSMN